MKDDGIELKLRYESKTNELYYEMPNGDTGIFNAKALTIGHGGALTPKAAQEYVDNMWRRILKSYGGVDFPFANEEIARSIIKKAQGEMKSKSLDNLIDDEFKKQIKETSSEKFERIVKKKMNKIIEPKND